MEDGAAASRPNAPSTAVAHGGQLWGGPQLMREELLMAAGPRLRCFFVCF